MAAPGRISVKFDIGRFCATLSRKKKLACTFCEDLSIFLVVVVVVVVVVVGSNVCCAKIIRMHCCFSVVLSKKKKDKDALYC